MYSELLPLQYFSRNSVSLKVNSIFTSKVDCHGQNYKTKCCSSINVHDYPKVKSKLMPEPQNLAAFIGMICDIV